MAFKSNRSGGQVGSNVVHLLFNILRWVKNSVPPIQTCLIVIGGVIHTVVYIRPATMIALGGRAQVFPTPDRSFYWGFRSQSYF